MSDYVIETQDLTRYFGQKAAVKGLNLRIPRGGVFAFLGRNGAGKTTTIRMLLGFMAPTRGTATLLGKNSWQLTPEDRARIAYVAEGHALYGWMKIRELEQFQKQNYAQWNQQLFHAVLEHFGLTPEMHAKTLSRGQRAGVCLALALAPEPELLILDDPTLGLDPVARRSLVEAMLMVTQKRDRTILFSSHQLDDVERVADWIAIMDDGVLRVCTTPEDFLQRVSKWILRFKGKIPPLPSFPNLVHAMRFPNELHLTIANYDDATRIQLEQLQPHSIETGRVNLEQGVIDYLSGKSRVGSLFQTMGGAL
jgi:ABC-2 type transport system ATP-binding protein